MHHFAWPQLQLLAVPSTILLLLALRHSCLQQRLQHPVMVHIWGELSPSIPWRQEEWGWGLGGGRRSERCSPPGQQTKGIFPWEFNGQSTMLSKGTVFHSFCSAKKLHVRKTPLQNSKRHTTPVAYELITLRSLSSNVIIEFWRTQTVLPRPNWFLLI